MCQNKKKLIWLERKKEVYLEHNQQSLISKVNDNIKSLLSKGIKERPLFQPVEHPEEELFVKTYLKTCDQCGNPITTPRSSTKQKCIYCKLKNGSIIEAKKDFDLLIHSDIMYKYHKEDR